MQSHDRGCSLLSRQVSHPMHKSCRTVEIRRLRGKESGFLLTLELLLLLTIFSTVIYFGMQLWQQYLVKNADPFGGHTVRVYDKGGTSTTAADLVGVAESFTTNETPLLVYRPYAAGTGPGPVAALLGVALAVFSLLLYAMFGRAVRAQFDARLAEDARAVAGMIEVHAHAPWEFEPGTLEDFQQPEGSAFFEVWMDDGSVLARSRTLGARELATPTPRPVRAVRLPDGAPGRLLVEVLHPNGEDDAPSARAVIIAVARGTAGLDSTLLLFRLLLLAAGLCTLTLATVAAVGTIGHGLAPLERLAARVSALDARSLGERLPLEGLPRELRGTVERLNELLARLET